MSVAFGVVCRLLWYSSLAYDCASNVTLEFSTPRSVAPDAVLVCLLDKLAVQDNAHVALHSLQQGGDLWQMAGGRELIVPGADSTEAPAISAFSIYVSDPAAELVGDPYYTSSYAANWQMFSTGQEAALAIVLQQGEPAAQNSNHSSSSSSSSSNGSTANTRKHDGTCVTISGPWQAGTRYQLTVLMRNPAAPSPLPATAAKPPSAWIAPLQYVLQNDSSGRQVGRAVRVRGDKQGQICSLRPQAAAALPGMFSACGEAAALGWVPAGQTDSEACLQALQQGLAGAANSAVLRRVLPFTLPPFTAGGADSVPESACAEGSLLSPAHGGECINCSNAAIEGATCRCLPGYMSNLVGPAACGPSFSPTGNASDAAALAAQLCEAYAGYYTKMMQGQLADRLVHSMYVDAFMQQAAYMMDWGFLQEANASFWQQHVVDERMPSSPSRRTGVGPNCSSCDRQGTFKHIHTKQQVPVWDDRFRAVQALRLVGYMLSTAGFPCPVLWDPQDPLKKMYGRYDKTICAS